MSREGADDLGVGVNVPIDLTLLVINDETEWRRCLRFASRAAARASRRFRYVDFNDLSEDVVLELQRNLAEVVLANNLATFPAPSGDPGIGAMAYVGREHEAGRMALADCLRELVAASRAVAERFPEDANNAVRARWLTLLHGRRQALPSIFRRNELVNLPQRSTWRALQERLTAVIEQALARDLPSSAITAKIRSAVLSVARLEPGLTIVSDEERRARLAEAEAALSERFERFEELARTHDALIGKQFAMRRFVAACARCMQGKDSGSSAETGEMNVTAPTPASSMHLETVLPPLIKRYFLGKIHNPASRTLAAEQVLQQLVAMRALNRARDEARRLRRDLRLSPDALAHGDEEASRCAIQHREMSEFSSVSAAGDSPLRRIFTSRQMRKLQAVLDSEDGQILWRSNILGETLESIATSLGQRGPSWAFARKQRALALLIAAIGDEDGDEALS
jgi:hypothetical protein